MRANAWACLWSTDSWNAERAEQEAPGALSLPQCYVAAGLSHHLEV